MNKKITLPCLGCLIILAFIGLWLHQPSHSILIVVPDNYRGLLTIKQDPARGRAPDAQALKNFNHYVYEFNHVDQGLVLVDDISRLLYASEIQTSAMSVAPLDNKIISKNEESLEIVLELNPQ